MSYNIKTETVINPKAINESSILNGIKFILTQITQFIKRLKLKMAEKT